jgi:hypothetical protein
LREESKAAVDQLVAAHAAELEAERDSSAANVAEARTQSTREVRNLTTMLEATRQDLARAKGNVASLQGELDSAHHEVETARDAARTAAEEASSAKSLPAVPAPAVVDEQQLARLQRELTDVRGATDIIAFKSRRRSHRPAQRSTTSRRRWARRSRTLRKSRTMSSENTPPSSNAARWPRSQGEPSYRSVSTTSRPSSRQLNLGPRQIRTPTRSPSCIAPTPTSSTKSRASMPGS